ncbi:MAG: hypothetical protein V2A34_08945 [Lentisphaerota bacterium]
MSVVISKPTPFKEAIKHLASKRILPNTLSSADLARLSADIRRASAFSARVANADFVQRAYDLINSIVDPQRTGGAPGATMDSERMVETMQSYLRSIAYAPKRGEEGSLKDLSSHPRLKLIADLNTRMARGMGQFVQGQDPAVLDAFPCQELFRLRNFAAVDRGTARDWVSRWRSSGGRIYDAGRMIARKDAQIWTEISTFGNPYPPYDYNSGMWTRPVSRQEAVDLGVISANDQVERSPIADASPLQASAEAFSDAVKKALIESFDGEASIIDGVLTMESG